MGKRRKDEAHDVGDSMPGTVGDSEGTIHDQRGGKSFNPDEAAVPEPSSEQTNNHKGDSNSESDTSTTEAKSETTRMEYAKRYGDSWPEERQHRFLREHDTSAKEMGWKLTE